MWYAIAPDLAFQVPAPVPVVRVVKPKVTLARAEWVPPKGFALWTPPGGVPVHPSKAPDIYRLPALFWQPVTLPKKYETSERGAIRYICRQLHIRYRFSGPNYALYGAGVSFDQSKPAIVLLLELAHVPYIQSRFAVQTHPQRQVVVRNVQLPGMAG